MGCHWHVRGVNDRVCSLHDGFLLVIDLCSELWEICEYLGHLAPALSATSTTSEFEYFDEATDRTISPQSIAPGAAMVPHQITGYRASVTLSQVSKAVFPCIVTATGHASRIDHFGRDPTLITLCRRLRPTSTPNCPLTLRGVGVCHGGRLVDDFHAWCLPQHLARGLGVDQLLRLNDNRLIVGTKCGNAAARRR